MGELSFDRTEYGKRLVVRDMYYFTENYKTDKIVGKGGMGVLYRCTSMAEPHKQLVVKVLKKSSNTLSNEL